jgi:SnoaL-like domain
MRFSRNSQQPKALTSQRPGPLWTVRRPPFVRPRLGPPQSAHPRHAATSPSADTRSRTASCSRLTAEQALVGKFVRARQSGDVDALVALLTADVSVSMPPIPLEYHGRDVVARFCASLIRRRRHDLVPTRANGQPAFGRPADVRQDT